VQEELTGLHRGGAAVSLEGGRYSALVRAGHGEAPEDLGLADRVLALAGLVWVALFAPGVHAAG
jgi:hypothetical protein